MRVRPGKVKPIDTYRTANPHQNTRIDSMNIVSLLTEVISPMEAGTMTEQGAECESRRNIREHISAMTPEWVWLHVVDLFTI